MWHLTACKISVSLVFELDKNEMIFYRISKLILATLIQRYDNKSFRLKNERKWKFYRLSGATFYDCINTIYKFIKPFSDNKISIYEKYGAFKWILSSTSITSLGEDCFS